MTVLSTIRARPPWWCRSCSTSKSCLFHAEAVTSRSRGFDHMLTYNCTSRLTWDAKSTHGHGSKLRRRSIRWLYKYVNTYNIYIYTTMTKPKLYLEFWLSTHPTSQAIPTQLLQIRRLFLRRQTQAAQPQPHVRRLLALIPAISQKVEAVRGQQSHDLAETEIWRGWGDLFPCFSHQLWWFMMIYGQCILCFQFMVGLVGCTPDPKIQALRIRLGARDSWNLQPNLESWKLSSGSSGVLTSGHSAEISEMGMSENGVYSQL